MVEDVFYNDSARGLMLCRIIEKLKASGVIFPGVGDLIYFRDL